MVKRFFICTPPLCALFLALFVACTGVHSSSDGSASFVVDRAAIAARAADASSYTLLVSYSYGGFSGAQSVALSDTADTTVTVTNLPYGKTVTFTLRVFAGNNLIAKSVAPVSALVKTETPLSIPMRWAAGSSYPLPQNVRWIASYGARSADGSLRGKGSFADPLPIEVLSEPGFSSTDPNNPAIYALLDDVTIGGQITIPAPSEGTYTSLYLNGNTITRGVENDCLFALQDQNAPNLTIYGGDGSAIDGNAANLSDVTQPLFNMMAGTLTLNGVVIQNAKTNGDEPTILVQTSGGAGAGGGLVTLNDCTITHCDGSSELFDCAQGMTILNGTVIKDSSASKYILQAESNGAAIILTGGTAILNSVSVESGRDTAIIYDGGTVAIVGASVTCPLGSEDDCVIRVANNGRLYIKDAYTHLDESGTPTEYQYSVGNNDNLVYATNGYAIIAPSAYESNSLSTFDVDDSKLHGSAGKIKYN